MWKTFFHSISENLILERIDGIGKTNDKNFFLQKFQLLTVISSSKMTEIFLKCI